jgi:hypothetical protein
MMMSDRRNMLPQYLNEPVNILLNTGATESVPGRADKEENIYRLGP